MKLCARAVITNHMSNFIPPNWPAGLEYRAVPMRPDFRKRICDAYNAAPIPDRQVLHIPPEMELELLDPDLEQIGYELRDKLREAVLRDGNIRGVFSTATLLGCKVRFGADALRVTADEQRGVGRIPELATDDPTAVYDWARELYTADLAFHLDDDPADVRTFEKTGWEPQFEPDEVEELRRIVAQFDDADRDEYFDGILDAYHENMQYFETMDGPDPDAREADIRKALGTPITRPHPDDLTIEEIARQALAHPAAREHIADTLDLADAEIERLRHELLRRAGPSTP